MFKTLLNGAREVKGDSWFKRGLLLGSGIGLKMLMDGPFDYVLYPIVMWYTSTYYGSWLLGALIMTLASIPLNWFQVRLYDAAKVDFFSLEALKAFEAEDSPDATRWQRFQNWIKRRMRQSKIFAFLVLSWNDPFYVVVYFRHHEQAFQGMTKRDWLIFMAATVVANGYWIVLVLLGIETVETAGEIGGYW